MKLREAGASTGVLVDDAAFPHCLGSGDVSHDAGEAESTHAAQKRASDPEAAPGIAQDSPSAHGSIGATGADGKTSSGSDGNDFSGDARDMPADTDVVMTDASPPLETEAAAGAERPSSRRSRKRGAPTQPKDDISPAANPSTRPERQLSGEVAGMATKDEPTDHADPTKADEPAGEAATNDTAARTTYQEEDSDAEFEPAPSTASKNKMPASQTKRGGARGIWSSDHLLQDPKSKLAKVDITVRLHINPNSHSSHTWQAILKDPRAWSSLNPEQQSKIISLLPNAPALNPDPGNPTVSLPNIPQQVLACNSAFKADIAMFQDDLSEGRLDPDWQHDGLVAMERRARGEFDAWKEAEMESFWGQKQKLSYDVVAGESSKIKLEALVAAGCWEVGDVWLYTRTFGKGKGQMKVEKEATITSITEDNRLIFRFPDGQRKFSSAAAGADVDTEPISGLQDLADAIIETDGRIKTWRGNNAWKETRCFRKNQDIGSPWEIREIYWARQEESKK
ncbi:hypothetical protein SLS56_010204 [Neofusicoccum ribis]|uniref:DEUBAD domain-containing protein n=1 Tax=Neofusicoccum ribis TaxID=45134 RepID=A0ABR3SF31_9PEZI